MRWRIEDQRQGDCRAWLICPLVLIVIRLFKFKTWLTRFGIKLNPVDIEKANEALNNPTGNWISKITCFKNFPAFNAGCAITPFLHEHAVIVKCAQCVP